MSKASKAEEITDACLEALAVAEAGGSLERQIIWQAVSEALEWAAQQCEHLGPDCKMPRTELAKRIRAGKSEARG